MEKLKLIAERVFLSSLIVLQIIFYPAAASYADTAPSTATSPESTITAPSTTTTAPTTQQVTEAAPDATTSAATTGTTPVSSGEPTSKKEIRKAKRAAKKAAKVAALATPVVTSPENTIDANATNKQAVDIDNKSGVTNNIISDSLTGNATVKDNNHAGSALTGDALVVANLVNTLSSQSNVLGNGTIATFTHDINGDVIGDLFIDPGALTTVRSNLLNASDVTVNNQGYINNVVDLNALSGNATVKDNNHAGNATTGDADAVANIVNVLNSIITAGGSFIGTINIHGNLQGDILLPPKLLDSVIASNKIPTTTISLSGNNQLNAALANNQAINNQVNLAASTGDAKVKDNNHAGNATTGDATTNLTVLNLTGHEVIGANSLLVFVNVLGKWVGVIMDAPAGNTAAALGGGLIQSKVTNQANLAASNDQQINNTVNLNATSGDATVKDNNWAGNATTGDATASANIANVMNSEFNLSNWFGILFINVFGTWNGSFGVNTPMGDPTPVKPAIAGGRGSGLPAQVFRFIPNESNDNSSGAGQQSYRLQAVGSNSHIDANQSSGGSVASATGQNIDTKKSLGASVASADTINPLANDSSKDAYDWTFPALGIIVALTLLGIERLISAAGRRRA